MKLRIYTDTSVIGGCFDEEFAEPSNQLIQKFVASESTLIISNLILSELERAPDNVRLILDKISEANKEYVELTDDAKDLANKYISENVIGLGSLVDAQHIALATLSRVDVLVSWNFKHIVNLERIHGYNSVNLRLSLPQLEIRTPKEIFADDNKI